MSERPRLDDALRAMLETRAQRATLDQPNVRAIVAAAGPRTRRPLPGWGIGPRVGWAGGATALAIVMVVLVARPLFTVPASVSSGAPGATSTTAEGSTAPATPVPTIGPAPTPFQLLSSAEAGTVIVTESATHSGALIAVQGRLELRDPQRCRSVKPCGPTVLADSGSGFFVQAVGDVGPGPWDGSGPIEGALILRLGTGLESGSPVAEFVGPLTTPPTGGPAWFVQDILGGAIRKEGSYAAVRGWLVRDGFHPCPSDPRNPPLSYGCPTDDWLTEDEYQPLQPGGSSLGPSAAIFLASGSYDHWAPDPAAGGPGARGVQPREATYLMWLVSDGCGPNADCLPPPPRWRIVGRFDPIEPVAGTPRSPDPVVATDGRVPPPDGEAWTVGQLLDRPMGDGTFLVRGWLVATPWLRCLESLPRPSGEPDYGCSEEDWLTDEAFQPWVANGSGGGIRGPAVGIRVQSGAYGSFARSAAMTAGGGLVPQRGSWIVHETTRGAACPLGNACAIPTIHWEVIARLP